MFLHGALDQVVTSSVEGTRRPEAIASGVSRARVPPGVVGRLGVLLVDQVVFRE